LPNCNCELRGHNTYFALIAGTQYVFRSLRCKYILCPRNSARNSGLEAAPDFSRPARQLEIVRGLYPGVPLERHTKWAGDRPMLPDSLPVIGRSPRHANVVYAFGHGQYGLALAAATGRLVAELVGERPTTLDLQPLRVDRF
jgi:D-amino-acid dehydrogenase